MKEREFQGWVTDTAQRFRWRVYHVPLPMRPIGEGKMVPDKRGRGLLDLTMFHENPHRLIYAELKGDGDHPVSEDQEEFIRLASNVAELARDYQCSDGDCDHPPIFAVYVWRPGQEDTIEAILRGKIKVEPPIIRLHEDDGA